MLHLETGLSGIGTGLAKSLAAGPVGAELNVSDDGLFGAFQAILADAGSLTWPLVCPCQSHSAGWAADLQL